MEDYFGKTFYTYLDSDKAWEMIEYKSMGYNRNIDDLYPDKFDRNKNLVIYQKAIDKMILEGEQYEILDNEFDNYALTSFGRILNLKKATQNSVYFKPTTIKTSIRDVRINLATEFMKYGWEFNINDIKRKYDTYKWMYTDKHIHNLVQK